MRFNLLTVRSDFNLYGNEVNMVLFWHSKGACILMLIFAIAIIYSIYSCYLLLGKLSSQTMFEKNFYEFNEDETIEIDAIPWDLHFSIDDNITSINLT
jgi:hypothetical protein